MTSPDSPVSVHVWSDIACPWCYIGKRRFERGVGEFGGAVMVEYHSFELAPDTPVDFEGTEVDFLSTHKGMPKPQVEQMLQQMTELAAAEGLNYDFDAVRHTKTLLAHQALHFAKSEGKQQELVERLFAAYFEEGRHLGRVEELKALSAEVGLDPEKLGAALADGTHAEAVREDIATARRYGIQGVPFYIIEGKYGISGAQSPETFASALRRVTDERAQNAERVQSPGQGADPAGGR